MDKVTQIGLSIENMVWLGSAPRDPSLGSVSEEEGGELGDDFNGEDDIDPQSKRRYNKKQKQKHDQSIVCCCFIKCLIGKSGVKCVMSSLFSQKE